VFYEREQTALPNHRDLRANQRLWRVGRFGMFTSEVQATFWGEPWGNGPGLREPLSGPAHAWLANVSNSVVFRGQSPDYGRRDH
jgi:hypothetical protein